jgi:hypothetical protein
MGSVLPMIQVCAVQVQMLLTRVKKELSGRELFKNLLHREF